MNSQHQTQIILSHAGKQHSYQVAKALFDLGLLYKFYTSSYIRSKHLQNLFERVGINFFSRRYLRGLPGKLVESNWRFEIPELIYSRIYGKGEMTQHAVYGRDVRFDHYMAKKVQTIDAEIYWGFQGSCLESIHASKKMGKTTVCELTTAHVTAAKKILGEEKILHKEWEDSFDNLEFPAFYEERLENEPHYADVVVAASQFTKRSLIQSGIEEEKVKVLPLGCDIDDIPFEVNEKKGVKDRPLRILYVGRITQRKGIKYLLEAVKSFNRSEVELHIIGFIHGSGEGLEEYKGYFTLHPPISQQQLYREYKKFDVLALPSVFEGFGLVVVEAMAAGLPVITTPNTIGPDIITHKKDGFIVPIRDVEEIKNAINYLRNLDTEEFVAMCKLARSTAERFSWNSYKSRLGELINTILPSY